MGLLDGIGFLLNSEAIHVGNSEHDGGGNRKPGIVYNDTPLSSTASILRIPRELVAIAAVTQERLADSRNNRPFISRLLLWHALVHHLQISDMASALQILAWIQSISRANHQPAGRGLASRHFLHVLLPLGVQRWHLCTDSQML